MNQFTNLDATFDDVSDAASSSAKQRLPVWQAHGLKNKWWGTCLQYADEQIARVAPRVLAQLDKASTESLSLQLWLDVVHLLQKSLAEEPLNWHNADHAGGLIKLLPTGAETAVARNAAFSKAAADLANQSLRFCSIMRLQTEPLRFVTEIDGSNPSAADGNARETKRSSSTIATKVFEVYVHAHRFRNDIQAAPGAPMSCARPALVTASGRVVYRGSLYFYQNRV